MSNVLKMTSRPINLGLGCRSVGSPVLVDKFDGVLELEQHKQRRLSLLAIKAPRNFGGRLIEKIGALKKRRIHAALAQEPRRIGP